MTFRKLMALPDYKCSSVIFCFKTVAPKEIIFSLNLQCGSNGLDMQKESEDWDSIKWK